MIKRLLAVWHARNLEFVRDRGTLHLHPPAAHRAGGGHELRVRRPGTPAVQGGVLDAQDRPPGASLPERALRGIRRRCRTKPDGHSQGRAPADSTCCSMCTGRRCATGSTPTSPKGYIVEKLLLAADPQAHRQPVAGDAVRYVDWLFPGILGMNMMFSCLFGVGYVVLRYRKNGFLKRLHATPLTRVRVSERAGALAPGAHSLRDSDPLPRHRHDHQFHSAGSMALLLAGRGPGRAVDDRARAHHRRALLERGTGRRPAERAHLADDAAVGHLVFARGLAALGAVDRARLPAHAHRWMRRAR